MGKNDHYRSVYIHVPFCRHRCGYCDFTLVAGRDDLITPYIRALDIELNRVEPPVELDTLFFGGGTPTHLPPEQLRELFEVVRGRFSLVPDAEWSIEANPLDLNDATVRVLAEVGVNRVSLGAQSFDAGALKILERDHAPDEIRGAVDRLREHGITNISLDLIFGVPGQTLSSWRDTVEAALALDPTHISTYGLTFEKGTRFWSRRAKGQLIQAEEELEREMYALAMDELPARGWLQYELSNFARPGYECRHNQIYWSFAPFEAFGPGAARFLNGTRYTNHRGVLTWLKRLTAVESPVGETDVLTPEARAREAIFVGLRRAAGVERDSFWRATGYDLDELAGPIVEQQCARGLLEDTGDSIRLTREGRFLADSVIIEFLSN